MKKLLLIIIAIVVLILTINTKITWVTRDEWKGSTVDTCRYYGIWNSKFGIRLVFSQSCMPI